MGGKRIDKNKIRKIVSSQPRTFSVEDISRESKVSTASAYSLINEMVAEGCVVLDHKVGKRKIYAVSAQGSSDGIVKPNIALLSPVERFEHVGTIVDMVAHGISPSALITGVSGIGKTYLVRERLLSHGMKEDSDYIMIKGHSTPLGLYQVLHDHRDQTLCFDDCDSIFNNEIAINILKSALDSYDVRKVSWQSSRMPDDYDSSFTFNGQILFISNYTADRIDEAVKSRTFVVDLQMSRKEICEYLWTLLKVIEPSVSLEDKEVVMKELEARRDVFEQFNIRTFIKACRIYRTAQKNGKDWKKMLTVMV